MNSRDPAGMEIYLEEFPTFQCRPLLNIHDVMVAEKYRGQGLSKQLPAAVEKLGARPGCCKMTLEVLEENTIAKAAYRSLGFDGYQLDPALGRALFWEKKF